MKTRNILIALMAIVPLTTTSCSNTYSYESALRWVDTHYTEVEIDPRPAIATFTWDYHGTTGEKAFEELDRMFNKDLPELIPQFKDVIYWPGENIPIGKAIAVYHILYVEPLNSVNFTDEKFYPEDNPKITFKINNNELTVTDDSKKVANYDCTIVHVHNRHGFYRGIGVKISYGFIDPENIIKLKVIIELMYEDS